MNELKCPHCGEVFQVDESGYAAIVKQVRDKEFEKEILERQSVYQTEKDSAVKIAVWPFELIQNHCVWASGYLLYMTKGVVPH